MREFLTQCSFRIVTARSEEQPLVDLTLFVDVIRFYADEPDWNVAFRRHLFVTPRNKPQAAIFYLHILKRYPDS